MRYTGKYSVLFPFKSHCFTFMKDQCKVDYKLDVVSEYLTLVVSLSPVLIHGLFVKQPFTELQKCYTLKHPVRDCTICMSNSVPSISTFL